MSNDWVPFHRSLTRGAKRGLARATRFVYLELTLEARAFGGAIPLPAGFKNDVDALHDMLGGDKRELAAAVEQLTIAHEGDDPMVRFEGVSPSRKLVVVAFDAYQFRSDHSTPRVQKHREKKRAEAEWRNAGETQPETVSGNATHSSQERNHSTEQNKTEQDPPQPPEGARGRIPRSEMRLWGDEWIARYERGVGRSLGRSWAFDRKYIGYLEQAVEKHCTDRTRIHEWIEKAAFEFGKATRRDEKPEVWSSWQAKGLFRWLNEGRPGWQAPRKPEPPRPTTPSTPAELPVSAEEAAANVARLEGILSGAGRGGASG